LLRIFEARGFRNLEASRLTPSGGRHLILGANGAGKTSLLEAIYALATTRSFRTARLAECIQHGQTTCCLRGELADGTILDLQADAGGRERRLNNNHSSLAEHLAALPVISWTSSDLEILLGAPAARRRFLDRGVVGRRPASILLLSRYRQALDAKRKLLLQPFAEAEIEPWNLLLAHSSADLIRQRAELVDRLAAQLRRLQEEVDLDLPPIALRYRPSPANGLEGEEAIAESLASSIDQERILRQPLRGPHRDELEITWDTHAIRRVASAGERKALGILLVLAFGRALEAERVRPIYLLDDLDTELDHLRLQGIWRIFARFEMDRQVFVTSNRPEIWQSTAIDQRWICDRGKLHLG
jgi:DNA replication and repair protein RecF